MNRTPIEYERLGEDAWRRLALGAGDPAAAMRLGMLATVTPDGKPDARLLVLRGANRPKSHLWFHSDSRAKKVDQIRAGPHAVALFYDPGDAVQLRVYGTISVHQGNELARRHWQQLELAARSAFAQTNTPGAPLPRRDPRFERQVQDLGRTGDVQGRENFAVLQLEVEEIDWLQLGAGEDRRALLRREDAWSALPRNP